MLEIIFLILFILWIVTVFAFIVTNLSPRYLWATKIYTKFVDREDYKTFKEIMHLLETSSPKVVFCKDGEYVKVFLNYKSNKQIYETDLVYDPDAYYVLTYLDY